MKIQLSTVFLTLCIGLVATNGAENPPLSAAVFNFQTAGDKLTNKGADAASLLGAQLSTAPNISLIERQEVEKVLGEQELSLSGLVSPDTAAKVGSITGAKVLITGRIFESGAKNYLVAKIISTETSRVFGEMVSFDDPAALDKAVAELAPKIVAVLTKQSTALLATPETPAAQITRLKQGIQDAFCPVFPSMLRSSI